MANNGNCGLRANKINPSRNSTLKNQSQYKWYICSGPLFLCIFITSLQIHATSLIDLGKPFFHFNDVRMSAMASQIVGVSIVCSPVVSGADQRKYQSSASLAFVQGIHRWPVNSPQKKTSNAGKVSFWWRHQINIPNVMQSWRKYCTLYSWTRIFKDWCLYMWITISVGMLISCHQ